MDKGIPLGKVVGFPLSIDWSVLVIMWLFTWSLAATLPDTAPGHSSSAYWLAGACGAAVLLASLLAHELTHAIVARHRGVEVLGVKLWLFGGIAGLGGEAKTPGRNQLIPEVFQARRPLIRRYRPPPVGCPLRWSLWLLSGPHGPREAPTGRTYWRGAQPRWGRWSSPERRWSLREQRPIIQGQSASEGGPLASAIRDEMPTTIETVG